MLANTRVRFALYALALSVTLRLIPAPLAGAANDDDEGWTRTEVTIPIQLTWVNACNGDERVDMSGVGTAITRTKVQPDGTMDIKERVSLTLDGIGASGAQYSLEDSSVTSVFGIASLPFSFHVNRTAKLSGTGPDMYLHAVVKVTLNADGTITHEMLNVNVNCTP